MLGSQPLETASAYVRHDIHPHYLFVALVSAGPPAHSDEVFEPILEKLLDGLLAAFDVHARPIKTTELVTLLLGLPL
jgi:hypothetical protein